MMPLSNPGAIPVILTPNNPGAVQVKEADGNPGSAQVRVVTFAANPGAMQVRLANSNPGAMPVTVVAGGGSLDPVVPIPPVDPILELGPLIWLKIDDTLSTDINATEGGSMSDGGLAAKWFDSSGNDHTFSQATSALRPTYHTGGDLGGQPYVTFDNASTPIDNSGSCMTADFLTALSGGGTGSYSFLFLAKQTAAGGAQLFQVIGAAGPGGAQKYSFLRFSGEFVRYNSAATAPMATDVAHAIAFTMASTGSNTGLETVYLDSSFAPVDSATETIPASASDTFTLGAWAGGGNCFAGAQFYELIVFNRAIHNGDISAVFADWNARYGTSFNATVPALTAANPSASSITQTGQTISWSSASGGAGGYTYQLYRSTVNGTAASIAVPGNAVSGATTSPEADSGLTAQTNYHYVLKVTDAASTTALSSVLTAPTHGTTTVKIDFLGDSRTSLSPGGITPAEKFSIDLFHAFPALDPVINNSAAPGQKIRDLSTAATPDAGGAITALVADMVTRGVDYVLIMHGTNDAGQESLSTPGFTVANFTLDFQSVVDAITDEGIVVYVNQNTAREEPANTVVDSYNDVLAALTYGPLLREGDATVFAVWDAALSTYTSDDLHPNAAGVTDLADRWNDACGTGIDSDL